MASTGLCGPQQARSWMKASYDVSTGLEDWEHLIRSWLNLSEKKKKKIADLNGYCVCGTCVLS